MQSVMVEEPVFGFIVPAGHLVQTEKPVEDQLPGEQLMHVVIEDAPIVELAVPGRQ